MKMRELSASLRKVNAMIVKCNLLTMFKASFTSINNVIWVRVTEHKIIVECQDGRNYIFRLKDVTDFEVIHS